MRRGGEREGGGGRERDRRYIDIEKERVQLSREERWRLSRGELDLETTDKG